MKKKLLGNALSLIKGAIGVKNPVAGIVIGAAVGVKDQFIKYKKKNKESETGGEGNVDYSGIIGSVIGGTVVLVGSYMLMTGKITVDEFIEMCSFNF
jgi:hypothetical protein